MKILSSFLLFALSFLSCLASNDIIEKHYDICIYGGSSAGVTAALAIKRMGYDVLVIEPKNHLGGLSSGGLGQTDIGHRYAVRGISREFYRNVGKHYGNLENWNFEPKVAEKVFNEWVEEEGIDVVLNYRVQSSFTADRNIKSAIFESSNGLDLPPIKVHSKIFIDATYEGDLMAKSGISYHVGREANSVYGETKNGVQPGPRHQFADGIDPYVIPGDPRSGMVFGVSDEPLQQTGSGDKKIQAYCFRLCLTTNPNNMIPITEPKNYNPAKYELLIRDILKKGHNRIDDDGILIIRSMPNSKTDINSGFGVGMSTDYIMGNWEYPEADYDRREEIWEDHVNYTKGMLYFLKTDPRLPLHMRQEMSKYGYPTDEYMSNHGFTHELYVREARRMIGEYVMTEHNCMGTEVVNDGIALGSYNMDSHHTQTVLIDGMVKNEGEVTVVLPGPYPISYRSLVPKADECENLLVPVCLSSSHIAFGSIRMEPVFMATGQAAGMAAVMAIKGDESVQDIDVSKLIHRLKEDPYLTGQKHDFIINAFDVDMELIGEWEEAIECRWSSRLPILVSNSGHGYRAAKFPIKVNDFGRYHVYFYNPKNRDIKSGRAYLTLSHLNGVHKTHFNPSQYQNRDNRLIELGEFVFSPDKEASLEISTEDSDLIIMAEHIMLVPI